MNANTPPAVAPSSIVVSAEARVARTHAALIADDAAWRALPARIAADPVLARIADATRARVREHLAAPPVLHEMEGQRRLTAARLFQGRMIDLATVARLDGDAAAAARARAELLAAISLPDWNPNHFLDVGEYALGTALGLAWLRDTLTDEEADRVARALVEKALRPSFEGTPFMLRWLGGKSNWTQVCHAGLVAAALVVADREPELAARTVARAIADQSGPASAYAPDGAYAEGPVYWGYGTSFHVVLISLLEAATGSDHGLAAFPGFLASADYISQMVTPSGRFFSYGDSREQVPPLPVLHWFAARRGEPGIAASELRRLEASPWLEAGVTRSVYERLDALALWWRESRARTGATAPRELPLRWLGRGENPVAVARTSWRDPRAAFLGIKGGSAATSHAHRDAGSFVYEASGVRWALDLGLQDYHSLESAGVAMWDARAEGDRWRVFRLGLESHNVLRFDGSPTDVAASAGLREERDVFAVDLSPLHASTLREAIRRSKLAADGALELEDRWTSGETPVVARWQWMTRAAVEPLPDGARLRQDGRVLRLRVLAAEPGTWSMKVEEAGDLLAPYDEACPGLRRVTIRVATPANTAARLRVEARLEDEPAPSVAKGASAERFLKRVRLWAQEAPQAAERSRATLADSRAGRFVLPGSEGRPLFAGSPPRWHENPTPSGDKEWTWMLNRQSHWVPMLRAAALDSDAGLRRQVLAEWLDWIDRCPVPAWDGSEAGLRAAFDAPTPWRSLEAGIRMERSWATAWEALADAPEMDEAARAKILASVRDHGRVLFAVPPRLWPAADHNHYLSENAGLLRLALNFPSLPEAPLWRDHAWRELGRCLSGQFTEAGGQIEGCPHYHAVSLRTLAGAILLGREHGLATPPEWRARLEGGLAYALHSLRPTGVNVPWGDSDATARGPLVATLLAALALERHDELPVLRALAEPAEWRSAVAETLWHAPDPEAWLARLNTLPEAKALPRLHVQPDLGQAMLRNGWGRDAASVFLACRTPVNNGHAHIDPAGFDYTAFGRALLVDPGRFTYREGEDRYSFKRASWHNTVTIDGRDPFAYRDTWSFGPQREGRLVAATSGAGWLAAACEQHNFAPVTHRRLVVLHEASGALAVVDAFRGLAPSQTVQLWFHLDSTAVGIDSAAPAVETGDTGRANVRVVGAPGLAASVSPGRVSDLMDEARASSRACFEDRGGAAERVYVTRVLPRAAAEAAWPKIEVRVEAREKREDGAWPRVWLNDSEIRCP